MDANGRGEGKRYKQDRQDRQDQGERGKRRKGKRRPQMGEKLEQVQKFVHGKPRFADQCSHGSFRNFIVVGNHKAAMWRVSLSQDDVASSLPVPLVAQLAQGLDHLSAGDPREMAHPETSTTSSSIEGGIGSLCSRRLSKYPSIAS